ncbi:MAG: phytanoyl-CoA dioxygenase family protein [Pseudomonadota bacterium]
MIEFEADSDLGWCEHTPPNESVDNAGNIVPTADGALDPRAPSERRYDAPEVNRLREHLRANSGIHGLEICDPDEHERILRIFQRDGFVVVRDLLNPTQVEQWHAECDRVMRNILAHPGQGERKYCTESYRLPHRYSFGTSSVTREQLHEPAWAQMVDLPTTTPILKALFASSDYFVLGSGGDFCLPGSIEYQVLHLDYPDAHIMTQERAEHAEKLGVQLRLDDDGHLSARTQQLALIKTPPCITINFMTTDLTAENGPIRHIPGAHGFPHSPPNQNDEPEWMRLSTLVGAPAGAGVFRDSRAWHGATPNVSQEVRHMPNVEYAAPWVEAERFKKTMPSEVFESLTPYAQHLCRRVVVGPGESVVGAGVMHPLGEERERLGR